MINAIALDDEPLALQVLDVMCKNNFNITLKSVFTKPSEAKLYLQSNAIDLIFLDIQMPDISGLDFFKQIEKNIPVIFTTAFPEFAVEGFNVNAIDYLLKPFSQERFNQAIQKIILIDEANNKQNEANIIQVKSAYSLVNINLEEVVFIEGLDDYIKIHLPNKKFVVTKITMKKMMEMLENKPFVRIHRSFICPLYKIESVRNKQVFINSQILPIGASYENNFFELFHKIGKIK